MINRENWADVNSFLEYSKTIKQVDDKTLLRTRSLLRHLLEWADEKPLPRARDITPHYPVYLLHARNDGKDKPLSPVSMKKACEYARMFFEHMRREHPGRYKGVASSWVDSIRPARARGMQTEVKGHEFYTLEDMLKIAALEPEGLTQARDQAAMCFLYLSAMRVDAFVSLPVNCVDLQSGYVYQLPARGVRTKNHKAAKTSLLSIPELMRVVNEWDERIRGKLADDCMWYATINRGSDEILYKNTSTEGRRAILVKGMEKLCARAGVRYLSPHKLRHGCAVFSIKSVNNMAGLKAISQNMMHSSVSITDGIYGNMAGDDVHNLIHAIGADNRPKQEAEEEQVKRLLRFIKAAGLEETINKA